VTRIADQPGWVVAGVDTHDGMHVAAVVDPVGRVLGSGSFPADACGYTSALAWMRSWGELARVGVEGTGSYGAGLARYLAARGVVVAEVVRPNRQRRRRHGKSDAVDAVSAALAALAGEETGTPKSGDGAAESIRALKVARRGAVKARTQARNQLRDLIVTAPADLRERFSGLTAGGQARAAEALIPTGPAAGVMVAMASLGRRWKDLDAEVTRLDRHLDGLVARAAPPAFLARQGVATQTAATLIVTCGDNPTRIRTEAGFAALCGTSPVDASSGKNQRHRLNRGGDRQANNAIWRIVVTRLQHDPRTQQYLARRTAEGKTRKEVIRALKRYVSREVYKSLIHPAPPRQHPLAWTPGFPRAAANSAGGESQVKVERPQRSEDVRP
jgi:transposase